MRFLLLALFVIAASATIVDPVIVVPGLSGSSLETRYHKTSVPHFLCKTHIASWTRIWIRLTELAPEIIDCFMQTMTPHFDSVSESYKNCEGVEVRPRDFGGVSGIYELDPDIGSKAKIYGYLIDALEGMGLKRGETLFGAPYDWRVSDPITNHQNGQYAALQTLTETAFNKTGRRVHLIGHSLGSPLIHMFLATYTTQEWRDRYVASFISLAGPLGGSSDAAEFAYCGMDWRLPGLSKARLRDFTKNLGSIGWMMPFGPTATYTVVSTPQRNYTATELAQLYLDAGETDTAAIVKHMQGYLNKWATTPPGVETHIVYSLNQSTPITFWEPQGAACAKDGSVVLEARPGDGTDCGPLKGEARGATRCIALTIVGKMYSAPQIVFCRRSATLPALRPLAQGICLA
ncbi:putative group XV phospholipase A2 [Paratrimastix pyriformis]|uniref:Group XV phospholipase A2 n=1 Tax=Paratrimastix pyriformis TaxID=342808 RepID=A0ABQ8U9L6_9EUKA|nr:putative group XV phospholipase A2 [Paratrimastix pyriformis]